MTRAQAIEKVRAILDDLGARVIEQYFADHGYDAALEDELRCEVAQWKSACLAEIEQQMSAMARSMLN